MGVHGVSTVDTLLSCSATGSDHLSLGVYRHLLMPTVREAWRPQRLLHGYCTPCPCLWPASLQHLVTLLQTAIN
jgi:hypothetical protein